MEQGPPPPDSGRKFVISFGLQYDCVAKFGQSLDLAPDWCKYRGLGRDREQGAEGTASKGTRDRGNKGTRERRTGEQGNKGTREKGVTVSHFHRCWPHGGLAPSASLRAGSAAALPAGMLTQFHSFTASQSDLRFWVCGLSPSSAPSPLKANFSNLASYLGTTSVIRF
jgi:hypothetical protein